MSDLRSDQLKDCVFAWISQYSHLPLDMGWMILDNEGEHTAELDITHEFVSLYGGIGIDFDVYYGPKRAFDLLNGRFNGNTVSVRR